MLKEVIAARFIAPLREGGSLPGLIEADDLGVYALKFDRRRHTGRARRSVAEVGRPANWPAGSG
ncbi:HipA-like kinase domain-containing protein OS=Streptomyces tendae OX=1932 GN=F3L20_11085 PE=4 SV=1 [Streptomyces tendae]